MVSSLNYNEDIYDFLPLDKNQQKAITLYQDITGGKRIVAMISMQHDTELNDDRLMEAVDSFTQKLSAGGGAHHFKEITSQVEYEKIAGVTDFVYNNIPYMLSDSDYVRMEHILTNKDLVNKQLSQDAQFLMMPATGLFSSNISYDPLGLFMPVIQRMQKREAELPFEIDNGYIFTQDKHYAIVLMTSSYGSMESANNSLLVNYIDSISLSTMQSMPDIDIAITGSPVIAVDNANQIKADSRLAIIISVSLIFCLLIFSFRSKKNLILIGCSILFGWLFALAFIAVLRDNVSLIVLGIGSIIIGIAVNYPLHFVAHISHGDNIREVLKEMISPLLIGNITTVGAFIALIPLEAPALRDLGLFSAFMLIGTILFVLIFLPHLVSTKNKKREEYLLFKKISTFSFEIRGWMIALIILLTLIFGFFSLDTSFDTNMHHINYLTPKQERLMSDLHISAGVKDTSKIYIVSEGKTWDEALGNRSHINPILDSLKRFKQIKYYSDITSFISSESEQDRRIYQWNIFWEKHRADAKRLIGQYAPLYGFDENAFDSFFEIITSHHEHHSFDYFESMASVLFPYSFSESTGCCSVVDIVDAGKADVTYVESLLNEVPGFQGYSFDFVGMNSAVANALSSDFNYISFACGIIVFLFLWISFGRLELSILAFTPMAIGWLWILGIMNIFGMQFNIVNVILATFIFGQGDDYTIFMTDGLINEYAYHKKILPSYKNSIIISALIMFIGMGSLIVAKHPALHSLAEVSIVGMLTVVMMAWIVPPMIFNWLIKSDSHLRRVPVTIEQFIRTFYCAIVYLVELLYGCLIGLVIKMTPWRKRENEAWLHRVIYNTMRINLRGINGVKFSIHNPYGENYSRGSLLISNHQSILDPILMLALSPNILVLISDKVWNNPIVHPLFRLAGFIKLNQPMDSLKLEISKAINKGFNVVIFPEGKRNDDQITRFHQGAFYLANSLGVDILPVYLHGVGHVMPKGSGFASRGQIDIEIGRRISASQLKAISDNNLTVAQHFHHVYLNHYEKLKRRIRTSHFYHHYLIYQYTYKGFDVERKTRKLLRQNNDYADIIDNYSIPADSSRVVTVTGREHNLYSILLALVHPELEVHFYVDDPDEAALTSSCSAVPENLHIHLSNNS